MSTSSVWRRPVAVFLLIVFGSQLLYTPAMALTSGPSQPEAQGFQPAGTSDMVDLFSGDFSYNIPLFELPGPNGGYPFNLSYQSGIGMEQEASWVGLGWSMNPGAVNRQLRGLPDEFNGDEILTKTSIDPSVTVGVGTGGGVEFIGRSVSLSQGFNISMNNYKGMNYSIDNTVGFSVATKGASLGVDLSLNSSEGVSVNPSLGLGTRIGQVGVSAGYNSKSGLSSMTISGGYSYNEKEQRRYHPNNEKKTESAEITKTTTHFSGSSTISFGHPGYTPQVTMPMLNLAFSAIVKLGGAFNGVFPNGYVSGFYNEQKLKDNNKTIRTPAFGYMNYQRSTGDKDLLDLNREKDGMVSKESPNLAIPSLTYDIYSVTGQGIGAMYRPMRNDLGVVRDQEVTSQSVSAGGGVDIGIPMHVGANLSVNHSKSTSGRWSDKNAFRLIQGFQDRALDNAYEPWYFKVHGEPTSDKKITYDSLGGDEAVRVRLTGDRNDVVASQKIERTNWNQDMVQSDKTNRARKSRNQVIQTITNKELRGSSAEMLSLFKVNYINKDSTEQSYDRNGLPESHMAGLTALTAEGLRYTYAIPAYNTKQEEVTFAVPRSATPTNRVVTGNSDEGEEPRHDVSGTDKFMRITKTPAYAHSYLLTSIVGPDYVDIKNDGVTEDDLGYWVKFTYRQRNSKDNPFKWRDPFSKAHYQEGWKTDAKDDKGSYTYGEKELWYLERAETKSHIAVFHTAKREDGYGAKTRLQNNNLKEAKTYRLMQIDLFTRIQNYKLKSVRFEYDYSLCKNVANSILNTDEHVPEAKDGKLTLKKVWFEYGNTLRGKLNPYLFEYNSENPDYNLYAFDRWGTYKPADEADPLRNIDAPYSLQSPADKKNIDRHAAAWSLTDIQLPSGGKIRVDYETDDYGYVQQQQAMQMFELVDPYTALPGTLSSSFLLQDKNMKVRFRLEKPVADSPTLNHRNEVLKYIDQQRKQLFFKMRVNLRKQGENQFEYISGYADINLGGQMQLEGKDANGLFTYGSFMVVPEAGYHPFSVRAWQHLRTNQPEMANPGTTMDAGNGTAGKISLIKSITGMVAQVREMFEGYNRYCSKNGWGKEVITAKSWIRLNSPDKIKYGGGLRVRQITINDQWAEDTEGIYGQIYEYTTTDESDLTISSGVAAYEPFVGGEENAVRYAKKFAQSVPLRSDNNMFFEYPINETYYPGPQVGYSKVTVTSLASANLAKKRVLNIHKLPDSTRLVYPVSPNTSYGTSGATVHEFYTCKDFPVITYETDKQNKPYKLNITIPFLGSVSTSHLTASQGYSIITNDMHGKQKQVSNYRQSNDGKIDPKPISWVKYNYRRTDGLNRNGNTSRVVNVFKDNGDGTLSIPTVEDQNAPQFLLGQETEFFTDMRQFIDQTWGGGANVNTDAIYILFGVIPLPSWWPNVTKSESMLRTAVTNKVIFKSGILESTEAFDGSSHVTTRNLKWDKQTGMPVLTQVTNNFEAPVYSYSIPAYTQYPGMGAAYQNTGLTFSMRKVRKLSYSADHYEFLTPVKEKLFIGDEFLIYPAGDEWRAPLAKAVFIGEEDGRDILISDTELPKSEYRCLIVRSGFRNILSTQAGSITALQDPSVKGPTTVYDRKFKIPR